MADKRLKYLFTVLYKDGSLFEQNPQDISCVDPQRSAYTDATTEIENGKFVLDAAGEPVSRMDDIHRFLLLGFDDRGKERSFMVDLVTGHFEIDTAIFRIHDSEVEYSNRRLIFFRRHYHDININFGIGHDKKQTETKLTNERIFYRIGWEADTPDGKKAQYVIEVE